MSSCCRSGPCEEFFDSAQARRDLAEYLEHGLGALETRMLAALPTGVEAGARVLEIGGGVGAIQAELLARGAGSGEVVELVAAYAPYAALLAERRSIEGHSSFRVHDLLADPEGVLGADIVVLNRVVCCSSEGPELAAAAAHLTRRALLLSFPPSNAFTRSVAALQRAIWRLFGRRYRAYAWPEAALLDAARAGSLSEIARGGTFAWRYLVLARA